MKMKVFCHKNLILYNVQQTLENTKQMMRYQLVNQNNSYKL
jgi:hypothetical protein